MSGFQAYNSSLSICSLASYADISRALQAFLCHNRLLNGATTSLQNGFKVTNQNPLIILQRDFDRLASFLETMALHVYMRSNKKWNA